MPGPPAVRRSSPPSRRGRARGLALALGALGALLAGACTAPDLGGPGVAGSAAPPSPSTTAAPPAPLHAAFTSWKLDKAWSRAVALADGHRLLVFSGLNAAKQSVSRVVHIDPATGKIVDEPKLPHIWHDAAGAWFGDTALLVGGGEQNAATDEVTAVTGPRAGTVIGHLTEGRSDLSAVTVGGTLYVLGGYDEKRILPSVLSSSDGSSFRPFATMDPPVRYGATVTVGDNKIYVFGGKTATGQTDAVQQIDTVTGAVSTVAHLPQPLGHAFAFVLGGSIYVAGGAVGDATVQATDQVWGFEPASGALTPAGTLPAAVTDGGVAVVDDHAYLVGGENGAGTPLNTVIELHR